MRKYFLLQIILFFMISHLWSQEAEHGLAGIESSEVSSDITPDMVTGTYKGEWKSADGFLYSAIMSLNADSDNNVTGTINWTLKASPRKDLKSKVGLSGKEFVKGNFEPESGLLLFNGYDKDDPNTILGLDKYRPIISRDGSAIGGITWNHDHWKAYFCLFKIKPAVETQN